MFTEFTKKRIFEQLMLAVASSSNRSHSSCGSVELCVETLVILQATFHVVSSLLSVLKIVILMLAYALPLKMNLSQKQNTVNLESASFVVIMLLHKGLTHIHSQKKPRLHFGESFTLI